MKTNAQLITEQWWNYESAAQVVNTYLSQVQAQKGVIEAEDCLKSRVESLKRRGIWDDSSVVWLPHGYKEKLVFAAKGGLDSYLIVSRGGTRTRKGTNYLTQVPYNLLKYSQGAFNNTAYWIKLGSPNVTVSDNTVVAPDGTLTATRITNSDSTVGRGIRAVVDTTWSASSMGTFTASFWAKSSEGITLNCDISDVGGGQNLIATLTSEWQRFSFTATRETLFQIFLDIVFATGTSVGSTFDLWGAQVVAGSEALDYFPTTTRQNVPAIDYSLNPSCPSWSLNKVSTNLLLQSESLDVAPWSVSGVTISPNAIVAPDGLSTADKIIPTAASTPHYHNQNLAVSDATNYTISFYAKAGGHNFVSIAGFGLAGGNESPNFDLANGTIYLPATSTIFKTASIERLLDENGESTGWFRCIATILTSTVDHFAIVIPPNGTENGNPAWLGNGVDGVYVWGTQVETGTYATSYVPTTSGTVQRIADSVDAFYPKRTNFLRYSSNLSEGAWVKNGTTVNSNTLTDPIGGTTADELVASAGVNSQHTISQNVIGVAHEGEWFTFSTYVKYINHRYVQLTMGGLASDVPTYVNFDLLNGVITQQDDKNLGTIEDAGGGWYRISAQILPTAVGTISNPLCFIDGPTAARSANSTTTGVEKVGVWGMQCERGQGATNYIATEAGMVHDGSVIGQTQGGIYVEASSFNDNTTNKRITITDNTNQNRLIIGWEADAKIKAYVVSGGGTLASITGPTFTPGVTNRVLFSYSQNRVSLTVDGVVYGEDLVFTLPPSCCAFNLFDTGSVPFYGHIEEVAILTKSYTDSRSVIATTPEKWYVRPSGGSYSTEDGKTYASAWDGFANIDWDAMPDGSTLYISGTHNEALTVGKSSIIIKSNPLDPAVINSQDVRNAGIVIQNKRNVVLSGIESIDAVISCLHIEDSKGIVTHNCTVSGSGNQGIQHLGASIATHNNLLADGNADDGVSGHDSSIIVVNGGTLSNNFQGANNVGTSVIYLNEVTFSGNTVDADATAGTIIANDCIFPSGVNALSGGTVEFTNCHVQGTLNVATSTGTGFINAVNSVFDDVAYGSDALAEYESCVVVSGSVPVNSVVNYSECRILGDADISGVASIEHCLFDGTGSTDHLFDVQSGGVVTIRYSVFKNIIAAKFGLAQRLGGSVLVDNCIFAGNGNVGRGIFAQGNIEVNNCIFYDLEIGHLRSISGTHVLNNCCFFDCTTAKSGPVTSNNEVTGNPLFTNVALEDFSLGGGSSCIGTGKNLGSEVREGIQSATWGDADTVPDVELANQGELWNIGAYV